MPSCALCNPPPPCPDTGLTKHGGRVLPHLWASFWNHRFCGSNPMGNGVCGFVQAAGGVYVGVKVLVWL